MHQPKSVADHGAGRAAGWQQQQQLERLLLQLLCLAVVLPEIAID